MKQTFLGGLTGLLLITVPAGCERTQTPTPPPGSIPTVTVTEVISGSVPQRFTYTASIEAVNSVTVRARVEGFLQARLFTEGDLVNDGDLLYRIDPAQFEANLRAAEGTLAIDQAALIKAQTDLKRYERLLAKKDIPQETYDTALAVADEAKAKLTSSQAEVDQAKLQLGYTYITAPLTGRIGESRVDVGNLVGPNENAELATIVQVDPIYVGFSPGGADIDAIAARQGQAPVAVQVTLPGSDIAPHSGTLSFIGNQVDPATGTLRMRAEIPNPSGALLPGRFARAQVVLGERPDTLSVPQRALVQNQGGFLLYVVGDDGKVQERKVDVSEAVGKRRVVTSGVEAGEQIIVDGVQQVKAGVEVKTRPLDASGDSGHGEPDAPEPGPDAKPGA